MLQLRQLKLLLKLTFVVAVEVNRRTVRAASTSLEHWRSS